MTEVSPALRILPEIVLTVTAVAVMMAEAMMRPKTSRKPLGLLAIVGTLAAIGASAYQLYLPAGTAFHDAIRTDAFSVFFHLVIGGIVLVTLLISLDYFEGHSSYVGEFYTLILFGGVGMMFMTCSAGLLMVFIGLEISSISTYILAGFRKSSAASPEASIKYFLLGSFATAFFLYGIALCYGATGSTNIYQIATGVAAGASPLMLTVAFGMILIGLGFKVSLAPFHVWTPDVYQGAPAPVVALLSTGPKAAAFAVLLRIAYGAYGSATHDWMPLVWILAAVSMTVGNVGALTQRNLKRLLAYSSIAHAGYLLAAFTALAPMGIASASFYTAAYAAMNLGAFATVGYLSGFNESRTDLDDYNGVARRHPTACAAFAIFLISLIGIPFTAGFFGKFYVFTAAVHSNHAWLAIIGLLNSGVAAFYYLRVLGRMYMAPQGPARATEAKFRPRPAFVLGMVILVLTIFALGIFPGRTLKLTQDGAATFPGQPIALAPTSVQTLAKR
jgi:NADH-quinone oxidoreductase subunit N